MIPVLPPVLPIDDVHSHDIAVRERTWRFQDDYVLGTRLDVLVDTHSAPLANAAYAAVRGEIDRLDLVFNTRLADSEISRLNLLRSLDAGPELFDVVQLGEQWRRITRGAFDGRMGELLRLWDQGIPTRRQIAHSLAALQESAVTFAQSRRIGLAGTTSLSLDALAKGYIVDAALIAARRAVPTLAGLAISIGGDLRCWGRPCVGWPVGIPDPKLAADNAPLVDVISLHNAAIATSGRGPRDCVGNRARSQTLSPLTGHPATGVLSASVVASHAADADALATVCLVLSPKDSMAFVEAVGAAARITDAKGGVHYSAAWPALRLAAAPAQRESKPANAATATKDIALPPDRRWPADWEIGISYVAPERRESERSTDFRTPYMVLWFTDAKNRPVNTPVMVGRDPSWHHDNFIWWGSHGARAEHLIELRSQATALSGRYRIFWGGHDDNLQPLPIGTYTLHLETSQERGKHEYRSIVLEIGRERFKKTLPNLPGSGGLEITYGHYNDRFKDE